MPEIDYISVANWKFQIMLHHTKYYARIVLDKKNLLYFFMYEMHLNLYYYRCALC